MKKFRFLFFFILLLQFSCKDTSVQYVYFPKEWHYGSRQKLILKNLKENDVNEIYFTVDSAIRGRVRVSDTVIIPKLPGIRLGKHMFTIYFYHDNDFIDTIVRPFVVYAAQPPIKLSYKLIRTYPHDTKAFTEGLEFDGDTLYESTGLNGHSFVRKYNYQTGEIYKQYDLEKKYFGEGITVWHDSLIWLTWRSGKGFVFNKNTFEKTGEFPYDKSKEGWGLTHNDKFIFKSDGTNKIRILDPKTLKEKDFINVYGYKHPIKRINELEWVDGLLITNIWQKNALAVIDPETGEVLGVMDLSGLIKHLKKNPDRDVLNGLALHPGNHHLFVTGKNWDKIFEIKLDSTVFFTE